MAEPSRLPSRKVAAGGIASAITTVIIAVCQDGFGYEISGNLAAAIVTIVGFVVAYAIPNKEIPSA